MDKNFKSAMAWRMAFCAILSPPLAYGQSAATAPGTNDSAALSEIVVTAQRRSQNQQDVPVAITAMSAEAAQLSGVSGISSLQVNVPSLVMQRHANNATPFLRGIGSGNGDPNAENSVAIYLDGVYMPMPNGNFFEFSDIDRVEVLKGPQGTLFGRNSTGGVIQVVTRDPTQAPELDLDVTYANYNKVTGSMYASGGLAEDLAGSLSLYYSRQYDGWGHDLLTGEPTFRQDDVAPRVKFRYTPNDATDVQLSLDYSKSNNGGLTAQPVPGSATVFGQTYPGRYNTWNDSEDRSNIEAYGASLHVDHDFDVAKLVSISAYRKSTGEWVLDQDLSPVPLVTVLMDQQSRMISQELHLLAPASARFQWLVGAYYFNYDAGSLPTSLRGLAFATTPDDIGLDTYGYTKTRSESLFGQGTYPLTDTTNLTLGARYTWDTVDYSGYTTLGGTDIIIDPASGSVATKELGYQKPTGRISLDHKFTTDVMGYVSWNRGVKSGGFSVLTTPAELKPYLPESLDAYEIGLKSELWDRRVRLNGAVFDYNFKNIQFQRVQSDGSVITFNGPSAKLHGAELELEVVPVSNLTLSANASWLHGRIGNFPNAPNTQRLPDGTDNYGDPNFNADGNSMPDTPTYSGSVGAVYVVPISTGTVSFAAHAYYTESYATEVDNRLRVNPYALLSASIGWADSTDKYHVRLWGKNLTDRYYYSQLSGQAGLSDAGGPGEPRTYGITIGVHFH